MYTKKRATASKVLDKPKAAASDKKQIIVVKNEEQSSSFDNFSLQSVGAYMMFQEVDPEASKDFCEFLIKANFVFPADQMLTILINSPGGDVYDGFGMIDLMECSKLKIQTVAVGIVASMAALVFTGGERGHRIMTKNSYIMTHQFSQWFDGKYHELIAHRQHEDDLQQRFVQHFMKHSKLSQKQVIDILLRSSDTWISAKEALKLGLCDKIQDPWN